MVSYRKGEGNKMENYNEVNSVKTELLMIPKSDFLKKYTESYRSCLLDKYKVMILDNYEDDLTEQLMREAVMIMDASEEEILKMYFEDAENKYVGMPSEKYFNQVFEASTDFP